MVPAYVGVSKIRFQNAPRQFDFIMNNRMPKQNPRRTSKSFLDENNVLPLCMSIFVLPQICMVMTKNMYKEIFQDLVTKPFKKRLMTE
jgi:hypothetical protein